MGADESTMNGDSEADHEAMKAEASKDSGMTDEEVMLKQKGVAAGLTLPEMQGVRTVAELEERIKRKKAERQTWMERSPSGKNFQEKKARKLSVQQGHLTGRGSFTVRDKVVNKDGGTFAGVPTISEDVPKRAPKSLYTIRARIADVDGAGTDGDVFLTMYGDAGDSGEVCLSSSKTHWDVFEQGNVDVFEIKCPNIGRLVKVKLRLEKFLVMFGSPMKLEAIAVQEGTQFYVFPCDAWLEPNEDGHTLVHDPNGPIPLWARPLNNCKLTYFPFAGRGEAARLALAISAIHFEDERVTRAQWQDLKDEAPWMEMPFLTLSDGSVFAHQRTILRLIGQSTGLYPGDMFAAAKVDELLDVCHTVLTKVESAGASEVRDADKKAARKKLFKQEMRDSSGHKLPCKEGAVQELLKRIDARIAQSGEGGYAVGDELTIADLMVFSTLTDIVCGRFEGVPADALDEFSAIQAVRKNVASHPEVKKYLDVVMKEKIVDIDPTYSVYIAARDILQITDESEE